jgi:hypothetical protein
LGLRPYLIELSTSSAWGFRTDGGNHKVDWIDNDVTNCGLELSGKARCWPGGMSLGFGQIGHAESHNTDMMLTLDGQLWMAQFAQRELKLKEVKAE